MNSTTTPEDPAFTSSLNGLALHHSEILSSIQSLLSGTESPSSHFDSLYGSIYMPIKHAALQKTPWQYSSPELNNLFTTHQLSYLWKGIILTVLITDSLSPWQAQYLQLVHYSKQFDSIIKELNNISQPKIPWEDYGFGKEIQSTWETLMQENDIPKMENLASFTAKALTSGLDDENLSHTALWYFNTVMESDDEQVVARLLPVTGKWYSSASYKLLLLCIKEQKGDVEPGPKAKEYGVDTNGFSLKRWLFWRKRLQGLNNHGDREVVKLVRKLFLLNIAAGRDTGFEVPGEKRFQDRLDRVMIEMLEKSDKKSVCDCDVEIDLDWVDE
ncbi:hypothetical protein QBC38DRAFT_480933 [Podospora fimiseda]|uniref:Uncharacterized protein n=1 Tax=Podospora fimiseda TaxID=252190 RepID=A0AAN7BN02_9PEZI|nr:hypothetical protein QBC38DRAFT_480933 [Podospora fimiseda]